MIISKFRKEGDDGPYNTITPSEFLRFNKMRLTLFFYLFVIAEFEFVTPKFI